MKKLILLGISHKTAPVDVREKLAVPENHLNEIYHNYSKSAVIQECIVLSTCNRVEIYAVTEIPDQAIHIIKNSLVHAKNVLLTDKHLYYMKDTHAVRHLFRVSAGLESLAVGETEILGQIKRAYESARAAGLTGKLTNVLFQRALYVGKHIRTKTGISEGPTSVANMAVALAQKIFGDLKEKHVLVIGAGETAETAAHCFLSQKTTRLTVINRTHEKAKNLADRVKGQAAHFQDLLYELAQADVVLCSTGAPDFILTSENIPAIMCKRHNKPLFIIDIAVPRDVDPNIAGQAHVHLYNIDDLDLLVKESLTKRSKETKKANHILDEKSENFSHWFKAWQTGKQNSLSHKTTDHSLILC